MYRLKERVALITLDEDGLADAVAIAFGAEGAAIAIAGTREQQLAMVSKAVRATGTECLPIAMALTDPASCERMIAQIMEKYGRLDILCNLAGEFPLTGPLHEIGEGDS